MGRSRKNKPLLEKVMITDVAAEGKSLGRVNDQVVFVPLTVPGDIIDVQVTRKRSKYLEGIPAKFHKYSDSRAEPFCDHFGVCGGCKWQILPYEKQLHYKRQEVCNNLTRIGKIELPEIPPVIPSPNTRYYRNKLEFTFSSKRWLTWDEVQSSDTITDLNCVGFHVQGMFDKVVDIKHCHLQPDPSNAIRIALKEYALQHNIGFQDLKNRSGFLRTLVTRITSTGETMVLLSVLEDNKMLIEQVLNHMVNKFPGVCSWMYVINKKANDTYHDLPVELFAGRDYLVEEMDGLKFKIGPKSFFQTNSRQAVTLYRLAREFAGLTGKETVYDLYTGTGTIANFVARDAAKVIGIDNVPEAIADARENSLNNGIINTTFIAGEINAVFDHNLVSQFGRPDVLITDPPRSGMHPVVVRTILDAMPGRIVYVSCNPATQARDLNLLSERYRVERVQPVDMFPHTHHVENVVLLVRK